MSLRIGLDLDGIVCDWVGSVIRNLNHYRTPLFIPPDFQPPNWNWFKDNLSQEDWEWMWRGGSEAIFTQALPYPGAIQFVKALDELGDLVVLTSRPKFMRATTIRWWNTYFYPVCPSMNFFFSGYDKWQVKTDVFIEDNLEYANDYALKWWMPEVFLLDRSWNQGYTEYLNVTRVPNYGAILQEIERLKNESTV